MPFRTEYFEREQRLIYKDVIVFHAYTKDGRGSRYEYWFSTDPDDDAKEFDVRELSTWKDLKDRPRMREEAKIGHALRRAIDKGELPKE